MEHTVSVTMDGKLVDFVVNDDDVYGDTLQFQVDELRLLGLAMDKVDSNSTYLDLGGNIGLTAKMALNRGFDVFAFEPSPLARKLLEINAPNANIIPLGVGNKDEKSKISQGASLSGFDGWRSRY